MATTETEITVAAKEKPAAGVRSKKQESLLDKFLGLLSSVRFGITMLSILLLCCMIGMLVMQQEVEGFPEYYQRLSPSQRLIFGKLGFFDIYHSWYFSLLLAITGLNIILASIDRFPTAFQYLAKPKTSASPNFIRAQMFTKEATVSESPKHLADRIRGVWRKNGMRARVTTEGDRTTVFAQKNAWNRIGWCFVHIALLTIFIGGTLTNRLGRGGTMEILPGQSSSTFHSVKWDLDRQLVDTQSLPFAIECTDIQQQLIRPEGGIDGANTVDWFSRVKIKDGPMETPAVIHMNEPFDYRGYRFFQQAFSPRGHAREITVRLEPVSGGAAREVTIRRDESAEVEGIGGISYVNFYADFTISEGRPSTASGEYEKPVAELRITGPDGKVRPAFAFGPEAAAQYYANTKEEGTEALLVNGNKVLLKGFEKVGSSHTLAVQYDPGRVPVYIGFTAIVVALCSVFFFSHQRIWAVIEADDRRTKIYFGGNTNRNRPAFEDRFKKLVSAVTANVEASR